MLARRRSSQRVWSPRWAQKAHIWLAIGRLSVNKRIWPSVPYQIHKFCQISFFSLSFSFSFFWLFHFVFVFLLSLAAKLFVTFQLYLFLCVQGDAVFWHNLLQSGEGDFRTRHAGCPVLKGWKWGKVPCNST